MLFLVVENHSEVSGLIKKILGESRVLQSADEIIQAVSAEDALDQLTQNEGKELVLIANVLLPGKTGIELANELIGRGLKPGRVILLSSSSPDGLFEAVNEGMYFLKKPFNPRELIAAVRKAVNS